MPVATADITLYKSAIGDSAGGGATGTAVVIGVKNGLWPDVSDVERLADGVRYRKIFIGNDAVSESLLAPKVWIEPDVPGFAASALGLGFDDSDDDTAVQGNMVALTASAQIELSSTAADTRAAQVVGISAGVPLSESVVLNGTTPVLSVATFSKVYGILLNSEHGTNTVTAKQGSGGATRGTIGPNLSACFLWVLASSEATALWLPDVIAGARAGLWWRQSWTAGATPQRPASPALHIMETV